MGLRKVIKITEKNIVHILTILIMSEMIYGFKHMWSRVQRG